jgi:hypothetical protein
MNMVPFFPFFLWWGGAPLVETTNTVYMDEAELSPKIQMTELSLLDIQINEVDESRTRQSTCSTLRTVS